MALKDAAVDWRGHIDDDESSLVEQPAAGGRRDLGECAGMSLDQMRSERRSARSTAGA